MPRPPSVLWTAPWRRGPLLRRSPAVLLAVLAEGLIRGAAAAQLGVRPGDRITGRSP